MPLYKTITVNTDTSIAIWKVEETEEYLSDGIQLSQKCQLRYDGMKSQLHRRAFLSIRHLLALYDYVDSDLHYDDAGKPHLKDGNYISITHSHNFTGIIISKTEEVGIDIEKQRDKILRIAHKFTPIQAYRTLANSEAVVRKLTIVWGAKESLYKIYGQNGISFLHHIDVADFSFSDEKTTAEILYKGELSKYNIRFLEFDEFACVYALREVKKLGSELMD